MDSDKRKILRLWLIRAYQDLSAALKLASEPDPMMAAGIFHCQQSAEKALKAFLILNDIEPEKTHNVRVLAQQAGAINSIFNSRLEQARYLNQYNRSFRYPEFSEDQLEPSQGQFNRAFSNALEIYKDVISLMPQEVIGQRQSQPQQQPPQQRQRNQQRRQQQSPDEGLDL